MEFGHHIPNHSSVSFNADVVYTHANKPLHVRLRFVISTAPYIPFAKQSTNIELFFRDLAASEF